MNIDVKSSLTELNTLTLEGDVQGSITFDGEDIKVKTSMSSGKIVTTTGTQTITGAKTFKGKLTASGGGALTGNWTCPTPDASTEIANKAYVDSSISSGGGGFVDVSRAVQYTHTDLYVSTAKQYSAEATGMFYLATGIVIIDGAIEKPDSLIGVNRVSFNSDKRLATVVLSLPPTIKQNEINSLQSFYYFPVKKGEPLYLGPNRGSRSISYYIIPFS